MERSFAKEIESLTLGDGEVFHGEGILAVTKALLQSGVSYVGGYQGAPVSHLIDVMVQAAPQMAGLGVHVEPCTNEASAAAMPGASIMYPVRGALTWKSIVGTNVAADALSNLASPGVTGGTLIVVGEDYGDGASVIQERTHAYAMKSAIWLMDPRPDLETIVHCAESAFELSEASNTPVMLELRIRACHVQGSFVARDNVAPRVSMKEVLSEPAPHRYDHLAHPPATFAHEKRKYDERMPAARACIRRLGLNEVFDGRHGNVGIIVQGGIYNALLRALYELDLADVEGNSDLPILNLNVVYPLVPEEILDFAKGKSALARVELTAASSQPLVQLQRDPDSALIAQGAFPDDRDSPAGFEQAASVALVPCHVGVKLGLPEILASRWCRRVRTPGMSVPEAAVNETHCSQSTKYQVGSAREFPIVQAVSETTCVEGTAKGEFGPRVPASDPRHHARTSRLIHNVRHRWPCTGSEEYIRQRISRETSTVIKPDRSLDHPRRQVQPIDSQCCHTCTEEASCLRQRLWGWGTRFPADDSLHFQAIGRNSNVRSTAPFGCNP